ncbi:kielin/chordin-like protein [Archocentrus centrarchus]|uniref:kielin/chordin-like protein n=1 Tax=Archocentrus centrarchus TaxID=63155 RepID=UPI0011EA3C4A|nr:kielin/chordin-like protein [Archocentrus centrarchus]
MSCSCFQGQKGLHIICEPWQFIIYDLAPPDTHSPGSWTKSCHLHNALPNKANNRSQDQTYHHPRYIQTDQLQTAVVLHSTRSARDVKSASQVEENGRLKKLERRMGELARVLDMVKNEIDKLQRGERLQKLEKRTEEVARVLDMVKDENEKLKSFLKECKKGDSSSVYRIYPILSFFPCPPQPCCPQPCPPQPCCPQPCCPQPCPPQLCPPQPCPPQPCPPQPCCPQPCPPQSCTEAKVPDCQTPACNPCPPQPRPPQVCPTQNCKEENVPDCQRRACDGGNRECPACSEENVPEVCEQQPTSCVVNGYDFPNGAVIPGGDPCQECRCVDGNMACSPVRCPALSCHNPVRHTGECCPQCEQCKFQSKVYENGETFTSKRHPCLQCHCSAGQVSCEHMAASCPTPQCTHPAKHRRQCCPTCSKCEYERRVYTDGTAFTSAGSGPCLQCRCKFFAVSLFRVEMYFAKKSSVLLSTAPTLLETHIIAVQSAKVA